MAIIKGNNQKNILFGTIDNDQIVGFGGDDILSGGTGNDDLLGGLGSDVLIGGSGNDILNGGGDLFNSFADVLLGGTGNDTYIITPHDVIFEEEGAGIDTVKSSDTWRLGDNLENLILTGTGVAGVFGNTLNNVLKGNDAANEIFGGDGNDVLIGGMGIDNLGGGNGNDILRISDFNGDQIDGGTGIDRFEILADNQILDLRNAPSLKNAEEIHLGGNHNTLIVDANSVMGLSSNSDTLKVTATDAANTLTMDSGWIDGGIVHGFHTYTKDGATLQIDTKISDIQILPEPEAYTISDLTTANNVSNVFDSGVQDITIDFGGKRYEESGVSSINLTGFGLEDKLIIGQHDGRLNNGTAKFNTSVRSHYISESSVTNPQARITVFKKDLVSWQDDANSAQLISAYRIVSPTKIIDNQQSLKLTGLPNGLADSQFVFF